MEIRDIIKDSFGRKHDYLRISMTDKCNFRCFYCMPDEKINFYPIKKLMTADELLNIAKTFVSGKLRMASEYPPPPKVQSIKVPPC